mgnify:CR=1 FL=1
MDEFMLRIDLSAVLLLGAIGWYLALEAVQARLRGICDRSLQALTLLVILIFSIALDRVVAMARRAGAIAGEDSYWLTQSPSRALVTLLPLGAALWAVHWVAGGRWRCTIGAAVGVALLMLVPGVADAIGLLIYRLFELLHVDSVPEGTVG